MKRNVALIIYDPDVTTANSTMPLSSYMHWAMPMELAQRLADALRWTSHGQADYVIGWTAKKGAFPRVESGYQYDVPTFLVDYGKGALKPNGVSYQSVLADFGFDKSLNTFDEIWAMAPPRAGFFESRMLGHGAFWCNAPPLERPGKRFVMMGFNFERGLEEALHSYGHRSESIMEYVFGRWDNRLDWRYQNNWERFTNYVIPNPSRIACGNVHFPPNGRSDYDYADAVVALSDADDWAKNFPNLTGQEWRLVNAGVWGQSFQSWWQSHLPHMGGSVRLVSNNWWDYIVAVDQISPCMEMITRWLNSGVVRNPLSKKRAALRTPCVMTGVRT